MISNEKYYGDALLQKTYTIDFLTKKRVTNKGFVPQYYIENSHEPIISKEIFIQARAERKKRKEIFTLTPKRKGKYSSKYALSNIMFCGECGYPYRRIIRARNGRKKAVWRCDNRIKHGSRNCEKSPSLEENKLYFALIKVINSVINQEEYAGLFSSDVLKDLSPLIELEKAETQFIDQLIRTLFQSVKVGDGETLEIKFKCGLNWNISLFDIGM